MAASIKPALLAALCCAASQASPPSRKADDDYLFDSLVDLNGTKIVLIHGTVSDDGRYAVGWTLARLNKKAEAGGLGLSGMPDDPHKLLDHYHMTDEVDGTPGGRLRRRLFRKWTADLRIKRRSQSPRITRRSMAPRTAAAPSAPHGAGTSAANAMVFCSSITNGAPASGW